MQNLNVRAAGRRMIGVACLLSLALAVGCGGDSTTPGPAGPTQPTGPTNPTDPFAPTDPTDAGPGTDPQDVPAAPVTPSPQAGTGTWARIQAPTQKVVYDLWGFGANDIWAVGFWGTILRYQNATWSEAQNYGMGSDFYDIWGSSKNDLWVVGGLGSDCDIAHYDGAAWTKLDECPHPDANGLYAVWGTSASDVWAVGRGGTILHYTGSWQLVPSGVTVDLEGVWTPAPGRVFVVGSKGTILAHDGSTWTPMASGTETDLRGVWGSSPTDIWAVGDNVVLHFDGATWQKDAAAAAVVPKRTYGIFGNGKNVYLSGSDGTIARFDGNTWKAESTPVFNYLHGVHAIGDEIWACGSQGTILHYQ